LSSTRAAAAEAVLLRDRQARECVYQHEQLNEIEKRKGEVTAEIEALTARLVLIEGECHRLQEEDARLRAEFDQSALLLRAAEESYAEKLAGANAAKSRLKAHALNCLRKLLLLKSPRDCATARNHARTLVTTSRGPRARRRSCCRPACGKKTRSEKFALELADARARVAKAAG
jgi:DNA repair exonuclease SbcCD ATPase subunit